MTVADKINRMGGSDAVLVYSTWPDAAVATAAAEVLVKKQLAACANILPAMTSVFIWDGRLQRESEAVMILKSVRSRSEELVEETRRHHPYDTPAIVVIDVTGGHPPFLDWIAEQVVGPSI